MRRDRELAQRLLEREARRVQLLLRLLILGVAVHVELIAAGAHDRRGEHLGHRGQKRRGEVGRRVGCEAELAGGRFYREMYI